jgi:hypothetical protein
MAQGDTPLPELRDWGMRTSVPRQTLVRRARRRATVRVVSAELRDYDAWHAAYDDPSSTLSWRLGEVQAAIAAALDDISGPVRLISACSGDGRDVLGALSGRDDAARVRATLLELHPAVAERARRAADAAGLAAQVVVRTTDAGHSDAHRGLVSAKIVLLVGIFGNIGDRDIQRTVAASPQLCASGAMVIWTRGRGGELTDRNDSIRAWFRVAGFTELEYLTLQRGNKPAIGIARYDGPTVDLAPGRRWFTFHR